MPLVVLVVPAALVVLTNTSSHLPLNTTQHNESVPRSDVQLQLRIRFLFNVKYLL